MGRRPKRKRKGGRVGWERVRRCQGFDKTSVELWSMLLGWAGGALTCVSPGVLLLSLSASAGPGDALSPAFGVLFLFLLPSHLSATPLCAANQTV